MNPWNRSDWNSREALITLAVWLGWPVVVLIVVGIYLAVRG
jgi:hypothetical protein